MIEALMQDQVVICMNDSCTNPRQALSALNGPNSYVALRWERVSVPSCWTHQICILLAIRRKGVITRAVLTRCAKHSSKMV